MPEDTPTPSESSGREPTQPDSPPPSLPRRDPFETVLTPIANPTDGRETARAVRAYLGPEATVYVAHVVQKGEGVPDKAGVEQRLSFAERTYDAFVRELDRAPALTEPDATTEPDAPPAPASSMPSPTPVTLYGRNVPRTILAGARDVGATAIVFTPRGAGRWTKLLTGNVAEGLLRESEIPVVALPRLRERLVLD